MEKEIRSFNEIKSRKGKCAAVFKLRESVVGSKKKLPESTVLIDPVTNTEVNSVEGIKRISLNYCKQLLTNRSPNSGYEDVLAEKYKLHEIRMKESVPEYENDLTHEMYTKALERLNKNNPDKYRFILRAGNSLKDAMFQLFKSVWSTEENINYTNIQKGKCFGCVELPQYSY